MKKLEKKNHRLHSKDKEEIPIVDSCSKKNGYLVFTSTDTALGEEEIIQTDEKDWTVEVYFGFAVNSLSRSCL